jgi:hypothetical protein
MARFGIIERENVDSMIVTIKVKKKVPAKIN